MEEVPKEEKEIVFEKLIKLKYLFPDWKSIFSDSSWTHKSLIQGVKEYAIFLDNQLYWEESNKPGHEGEIVYLIKPVITDFYRWIVFRFAQDEDGNDVMVVIISAHKDRKIYGDEGG